MGDGAERENIAFLLAVIAILLLPETIELVCFFQRDGELAASACLRG